MSLVPRILGPLLRVLYRAQADAYRATTPHPEDDPRFLVDGPDPIRVLLLGGGPANGYGVRTHALSLTGHAARRLAAVTGRGAEVVTLAAAALPARRVLELLPAEGVAGFDAVVFFPSFTDSASGMSPKRWRAMLRHIVEGLMATGDAGLLIVLTGNPLPSRFMDGFLGRVVGRHSQLLAEHTKRIAGEYPGVAYFELPKRRAASEPGKAGEEFGVAATALVDMLAPVLTDPGAPSDTAAR